MIIQRKPGLHGLPATFGSDEDVTMLVVHLHENYSSVAADLSYSIFSKYDAVVRSMNITIEALFSLSVDLPCEELEMVTGRARRIVRDTPLSTVCRASHVRS